MQWIWLLPSLGYGVYLYATTGQAYGLVFGGFSVLAALGNQFFQGRKEPVDLAGQVRFGGGRVAIGNRVLPRWQRLWQAAWSNRVYSELAAVNSAHNARIRLEQRLAGSLAMDTEAGLCAWVGYSGTQEVSIDLDRDGAHALLVGATGSGKSQLLTTWLVSLCQSRPPEALRLWLLDLKGGATLSGFAGTRWVDRLVTDLDGGGQQALADLNQLLQDREHLLARIGAGRIQDLPQSQRPPSVVVAIDEAQVLLADPATHRPIESLASRGRSLGIHLLLTSQSVSGIPRGLLTNLTVRFAVGQPDPIDLAQLGYSRAAGEQGLNQPDERWGRAILMSAGRQQVLAFPSHGLVSATRLKPTDLKEVKIDFLRPTGQNGQPNAQLGAESVVTTIKNYGFSIGL